MDRLLCGRQLGLRTRHPPHQPTHTRHAQVSQHTHAPQIRSFDGRCFFRRILFFYLQTAVFLLSPIPRSLTWIGLINAAPQVNPSYFRLNLNTNRCVQDTAGTNCIWPVNAYQKMALGVMVPGVFVLEWMATMRESPASCLLS